MRKNSVADPHHLDADLGPVPSLRRRPDPTLRFDSDRYPIFHFNADPDPHKSDANL